MEHRVDSIINFIWITPSLKGANFNWRCWYGGRRMFQLTERCGGWWAPCRPRNTWVAHFYTTSSVLWHKRLPAAKGHELTRRDTAVLNDDDDDVMTLLNSCNDVCMCFRGQYLDYSDKLDTVDVKTRQWQRWDFHYDNVAYAMLTLFAVQTGEGWPASVIFLFVVLWAIFSAVTSASCILTAPRCIFKWDIKRLSSSFFNQDVVAVWLPNCSTFL